MAIFPISGCRQITADTNSSSSSSTSSRFASGKKNILIVTSTKPIEGSFTVPTSMPVTTPIPLTYPGGNGSATYLPGVSPYKYFEAEDIEVTPKPDWLIDFQMGITSINPTGACAAFAATGNPLEPAYFYRVSEFDCLATAAGAGEGTDPVFFRIILDRDTSKIGSAENLLVQVEYQASGLHMNTDGSDSLAHNNLDQLWKIFWNPTLQTIIPSTVKNFATFVPPNFSGCLSSGTSNIGAPGSCPNGTPNTYRGSPTQTRQFMIPLASYPSLRVIQFSRVSGRRGGGSDYVADFCDSNEPLCLGVVINSVTISRM